MTLTSDAITRTKTPEAYLLEYRSKQEQQRNEARERAADVRQQNIATLRTEAPLALERLSLLHHPYSGGQLGMVQFGTDFKSDVGVWPLAFDLYLTSAATIVMRHPANCNMVDSGLWGRLLYARRQTNREYDSYFALMDDEMLFQFDERQSAIKHDRVLWVVVQKLQNLGMSNY